MKRYLILIIAIIFNACASKQKDENIKIVIDYPNSYRYDLDKQVFTVFFSTKPPLEIKFSITKHERTKIKNEYYKLGIDDFAGNTDFADKCVIMPKLYTMLSIKTGSKIQRIQIDEGCNNFVLSNFIKANRVKSFLNLIRNILQSKPQIKNAPTSDIIYL